MTNNDIIAAIRKWTPLQMAKDLCSVQPMSRETEEALKKIMLQGKSEQWLVENGFEPVCKTTRIMWTKKP